VAQEQMTATSRMCKARTLEICQLLPWHKISLIDTCGWQDILL